MPPLTSRRGMERVVRCDGGGGVLHYTGSYNNQPRFKGGGAEVISGQMAWWPVRITLPRPTATGPNCA